MEFYPEKKMFFPRLNLHETFGDLRKQDVEDTMKRIFTTVIAVLEQEGSWSEVIAEAFC